ncbi:COX1 assembly protein [Acrodontium crateriforme]|uniref:SURF1-like protein n=1 Tax=Acrodontium crateriforme TaxID=150365 RepID=A0AAQ3M778_9PEZI|nr:COX1 assembly protein [Acrodontium crateriforme]
MDKSRPLWRIFAHASSTTFVPRKSLQQQSRRITICTQCLRQQISQPSNISASLLRRTFPQRGRRYQSTNPADDPMFKSIVDNPPTLVRSGRRHNKWGLMVLAAIPVTAFFLGCWQVQRLGWKSDLIAKFEDRLVRDPLPLPPVINPDAVKDFDYRRIVTKGKWRHDKEMLIGPRLNDGEDGYLVITPLDRSSEFEGYPGNTTVLVCRGWIPKNKADPSTRPLSRLDGEVTVEGLLRQPWKKNSFTPDNKPAEGKWYFPDVYEMANHAGSQSIWVEETMRPDLIASYERADKGIPIGRAPEVNLRNNHTQYIFTWFSLSLATSIMLWMVIKKPSSGPGRRVRANTQW